MTTSKTGKLPGSGGVSISYRIDGPENAPWLILSNSLATDFRMWDAQMNTLSASRRVLRYDTRGHGQSDSGQSPYSFDQLTGDIIALFDGLEISSADFLGLSLGGMTGLAFAMREPDRVQKLVCCDARAFAPDPYKAIWDANIARLQSEGIDSLIDPTISRWFTSGFLENPSNARTLDAVKEMIGATSPTGYEGAARLLQTLDLLDGLETLQCETHYVTGEFDPAAPVDVMQDMADRTPDADLSVIPAAAHLSNVEQPEHFNDAIKSFLDL